VAYLQKAMPFFWSRHEGRDHVFFSTADVGWCSMSSTVRRKAILISHWGLLAPTLQVTREFPRLAEITRADPHAGPAGRG